MFGVRVSPRPALAAPAHSSLFCPAASGWGPGWAAVQESCSHQAPQPPASPRTHSVPSRAHTGVCRRMRGGRVPPLSPLPGCSPRTACPCPGWCRGATWRLPLQAWDSKPAGVCVSSLGPPEGAAPAAPQARPPPPRLRISAPPGPPSPVQDEPCHVFVFFLATPACEWGPASRAYTASRCLKGFVCLFSQCIRPRAQAHPATYCIPG